MLLDNHENRLGSRPVNRQPRPSESVEGETGLPDRIKNKIILISVLRLVVDHSQLHRVRLDFCFVTCTTQRAEIKKPIIWSVTSTNTGAEVCLDLSLPLITPLSAKNVLLVQQKIA